MNQRQKQVNEVLTGATARLTPQEKQLLDSLHITKEDVKKHGGIITINASDEDKQLAESICSKLGIAPERYVNVQVNKYDAEL